MTLEQALLEWYDRNRRTLPWRGERDPYRIWLSEIMLQQTQIETVRGYYARFLERFPTVEALADAEEDDVLKLWEGLGYYSRARNLHRAARVVAREMGGVFPTSAEGLKSLPGIGSYAANAIASIAYGEAVPALDGNQARVLSRVLAWEPELKTPFDLLAPALTLMSAKRAGDYNQALMDLGATVCLPKSPKCEQCPLCGMCKAFAADCAMDYPRKPAPVAKKAQDWTILLVSVGDRLLVRRRPKGLLGGLYEFCAAEGHYTEAALMDWLAGQGFVNAKVTERLPDARHVFTHLIWRMQGWRVSCDNVPEGYRAVDRDALRALAFPSALRVYRAAADT